MASDSYDDEGGRYNRYDTDDSDDNNDDNDDQTLELAIEKLKLGPKKNKLIIFSLNGLLIHRAHRGNKSAIPSNRRPDGVYNNGNKLVYKRPFLDEFMKFCLERFEVGLWSSAEEQNVDLVLDCAFKGLKTRLLFFWAHTGIFPDSYDPSDANDNFLDPKEELGKYLEGLANAEDDNVPTYVKANPFGQPAIGPNHPNWDFYSRVLRRLKN